MSHRLYDITLYYYDEEDLRKRFTLKQNMVSDLYVHFLDGYKPPKTSRISVQLSTEDSPGSHFGSILGASAKFDSKQYWRQDNGGQNELILNTVHRIALLCAEHYGWNKEPFEAAYKKVLADDFVYCVEGTKKTSRDRSHSASIRLQKNEKYATISAVFFRKDGRVEKVVELLRSFQHEMFYGGLTRRYKWFNSREFGMYSSGEEIVIKASLDHNDAITTITPKTTNREELEGQLRRMTYVDFKNDEERIRWANQ
jgi:hypothetical protein